MDDHFRFDSVFYKKSNQIELKKKQTGSNRPVSVRFFRTKTSLAQFFSGSVWFFWFGLVFLVWLGFFWFGSIFFGLGSVWFFRFQVYKTETKLNRSVFLKIVISLIGFFSRFKFFF